MREVGADFGVFRLNGVGQGFNDVTTAYVAINELLAEISDA